jgi:hypothetical protein
MGGADAVVDKARQYELRHGVFGTPVSMSPRSSGCSPRSIPRMRNWPIVTPT